MVCLSASQLPSPPIHALYDAFQQNGNPLAVQYGMPFSSPRTPLTSHVGALKVIFCNIVGAIVGLTALGHQAVRNALYPNLHPYLALLQDQMQQSGNEMKRYEAYKCFGALLHAAGAAIRDRVK